MTLRIVPTTIKSACRLVATLHRTHPRTVGGLFAIACEEEGRTCGVLIVGRPKARLLDDGVTAEVTRTATDGTANACSFLLGRAWRVVQVLGYRRLVTYTLADEPGSSLRAAGFRLVGRTRGGRWGRKDRPRMTARPEPKLRWEKVA